MSLIGRLAGQNLSNIIQYDERYRILISHSDRLQLDWIMEFINKSIEVYQVEYRLFWGQIDYNQRSADAGYWYHQSKHFLWWSIF